VSFELARVDRGLKPFWIGRREVSWRELNLFTEGRAVDGVTRPTRAKSYLVQAPLPPGALQPERPAINVRWHAAMAYCAWLSARTGEYYRLPTEREWEAACADARPEDAWHRGNSGRRTHAGGEKGANALGVYDMLGNVAEYCLEPHSPPDYGPVLRGGSWDSEVGPGRREPVAFYGADPTLPQSIWWVSGGFFQGFRVVRVAGAAPRADVERYAPKLPVRVLAAAPRQAGEGGAVQFFIRVRAEIRNEGDRPLDEVLLALYPLTPQGQPHWVDRSPEIEKPGRATFTWCAPALRNAFHPGEHGRPLEPGGRRTFEADVPAPEDGPRYVREGAFGATVAALCFGDSP
jgi:hypothetical protein